MASKGVIWIGIAIILIILAGIFILSNKSEEAGGSLQAQAQNQIQNIEEENNGAVNSEPINQNKEPSIPAASPSSFDVNIEDFAYAPAILTIKAGDAVTWTNKDSAPHTVTSDSGNELGSETLNKEMAYSHTFMQKGTFSYYCRFHPGMKAKVIVE